MLGFSLHGLFVAGPQGKYVSDGSNDDPSGYQAWMLGPEVRLFTPGDWAFVGAGLGIGQMMSSNCSCSEVSPATGTLGFTSHLSIGAHLRLGPLFLAPEAILARGGAAL